MRIAFFAIKSWEKDYLVQNVPVLISGMEAVFFDEVLNKDNVPADMNFEVLGIFVDSALDEEVLEKFPNLKMIVALSTGFDHIDLEYCRSKNIAVANVPSYGENTVAEYAFGLILTLSRKIFEAIDRLKETGRFDFSGLQGFDLQGKTLGVVGTGRIGRHVIKIANGFEMKVVAYDIYQNQELAKELGFPYLPLPELLAQSDIVTIHVPYMKETHHLFNAETISQMKKGAYLINTSRGGVVETEVLIKALQSGHLAGAGLDVLEEETIMKDEPSSIAQGKSALENLKTVLANHVLIDMPNVIITPHNAFNSREASRRILDTTIGNLKAFMEGSQINIVK